MSQTFDLDVEVSQTLQQDETTVSELNRALQYDDDDDEDHVGDGDCIVVNAESCCISQPLHEKKQGQHGDEEEEEEYTSPRFGLVFVPATIVDSSLELWQQELHEKGFLRLLTSNNDNNAHDHRPKQRDSQFSERLLSMVHPWLAHNFPVKALIPIRPSCRPQQSYQQQQKPNPSDLVVLDLSHTPPAVITDLLEQTMGQTLHSGPENAVLKILLIGRIRFLSDRTNNGDDERATTSMSTSTATPVLMCNIPTCPVCLHRIDPWRLVGIDMTRRRTATTTDHDQQQLRCSKFCPPPNLLSRDEITCPRQRLLQSWPIPSYCPSCAVVSQYWNGDASGAATSRTYLSSPTTGTGTGTAATAVATHSKHHDDDNSHGLFCYSCALQETLWVCMTCGFVGCGRYSNKHAAEHFRESGHPFCLELSTLRIWDYMTGEFVHRTDLLECPSSPPVMHPWIPSSAATAPTMSGGSAIRRSSSSSYTTAAAAVATTSSMIAHSSFSSSPASANAGQYRDPLDSSSYSNDRHVAAAATVHHNHHLSSQEELYAASLMHHPVQFNEKSPKKATMIGEEYEALLQSALEEQAQHYEGEITSLRATLTAEQVDEASMSPAELQEVAHLKQGIGELRVEVEKTGRELINLQSQEAGHRAASQRLLREQQVSQDLLKKIREETAREQVDGRQRIDELEQQIDDLTANQRMRHQFSQDQELLNAQIFGTTGNEDSGKSSSKKGKKSRRFFRK